MDDIEASEYWCHVCSQTVNPIIEIETIKCPICEGGFVEEMSSAAENTSSPNLTHGEDPEHDRALNLWAPILLGMLGSRRRRRRFRRMEFDMGDEYEHENENNDPQVFGEEEDLDREIESLTRRTRNTAALLELLRGMRGGMSSDSDSRDGERVLLLNPFNQSFAVRESSNDSDNPATGPHIASLGDYFMGPGLEVLLQHLAENDPNRYGTPPAKKEAVEALATVKIEEAKQCSVCLDDFEIGTEAKEMPCKHKFHGECLLPWLELHSSCPVCRYQLPFDESKIGRGEGSTRNGEDEENDDGDANGGNDDSSSSREFSLSLPWLFSSLFSSSDNENSSSSSSRDRPTGGN